MSTHKAGGKAEQHINPSGKRLGVKADAGKKVKAGNIIVRQRGTKITLGKGVALGKDHTIYAVISGVVKFGQKLGKKFVSVITESKKTSDIKSGDELNSDMSSSFRRGNRRLKSAEDVIK